MVVWYGCAVSLSLFSLSLSHSLSRSLSLSLFLSPVFPLSHSHSFCFYISISLSIYFSNISIFSLSLSVCVCLNFIIVLSKLFCIQEVPLFLALSLPAHYVYTCKSTYCSFFTIKTPKGASWIMYTTHLSFSSIFGKTTSIH